MFRRPPGASRTDTLFPCTALVRSRARRLPCIGSCGLRHWPGLVRRWRFAAVRRRARCRAAGKSRRKIMVLERAELQIREGMEIVFATAIDEHALVVLRSVTGVESVGMGRGVEHHGKLMLLVVWRALDSLAPF